MKRFLMIAGAILLVGSFVWIMVVDYQLDRNINGWKDRAQVSSEPNDMLQWITKTKEGMENWGMTSGYSELIWQTPDNDMALIYKTVVNHVNQAEVLTKMNRSTPEYQTGLDNLRGSIRELDLQTYGYWNIHQGFVIWIAGIIGLISLVIGVAWWYAENS
jgi:hypothetical protein